MDSEGKALFFSYQYDENNENTISHNYISAITEDEYGGLWIGTRNGLNRFVPETGKFERFLHQESNVKSIADDMINDLHLDSHRKLMGCNLKRIGPPGNRARRVHSLSK